MSALARTARVWLGLPLVLGLILTVAGVASSTALLVSAGIGFAWSRPRCAVIDQLLGLVTSTHFVLAGR